MTTDLEPPCQPSHRKHEDPEPDQADEDDDEEEQLKLYKTAIDELLHSSTHQSTTKEAIFLSSKRRTCTIQDMRYYWSKITTSTDEEQRQVDQENGLLFPPMIHVTGTKGKGSTSCMCEVVLRETFKLQTGLFTSPHLLDIRERIRIGGKPVSQQVFGRVYWKIRRRLEQQEQERDGSPASGYRFVIRNEHGEEEEEDLGPPPTLPGYFRMLTLMAYYIFRYELRSYIDVMIVEVGMGGRYDATNFIDCRVDVDVDVDAKEQSETSQPPHPTHAMSPTPTPTLSSQNIPSTPICVCGVTLLDYDHVRVLGHTLGKIAWEKGGIFTTTKLVDVPNNSSNDEGLSVITTRPASSTSKEGATKHDDTKDVDGDTWQHRRVFYILDSNTEEVIDVMKSCAQIEGQGGILETVDATALTLRQALRLHGDQGLSLGLAGDHQYGNATLAVKLSQAIVNKLNNHIPSSILDGSDDYSLSILKALSHAEWPARCQTYRPSTDDTFGNFTFYLDGAHTPQSLEATVDWFHGKINCELKVNDSSGESSLCKPILVFNCSHERNPLELLELLSSSTKSSTKNAIHFDRVYFTKSDSIRPSAVTPPTATELLSQHGIPVRTDVVTSTVTSTWQETLACLWRHVEQSPSEIRCNMNAAEVLEDLLSFSNTEMKDTLLKRRRPIFVTGSLYLVGSFLDALGWAEESSPIINDGTDVKSSFSPAVETSEVVDFLDVDNFNQPGEGTSAKSATTHGTEDGRRAGEAASFLEGQSLGASKGLEIGIEIGFAQGLLEFAREHLATLVEEDNGQSNDPISTSISGTTPMHVRVQRSVDELDGAIKDFPTSTELFGQRDTSNDEDTGPSLGVDVREKLQRIRARCKVLTVQLGIPHHSLKRVMDDSLRFDTATKDGGNSQAGESPIDMSKDISSSNDW